MKLYLNSGDADKLDITERIGKSEERKKEQMVRRKWLEFTNSSQTEEEEALWAKSSLICRLIFC